MSRLPGPPAYVPTLTDIVHPAPSSSTPDGRATDAMEATTDLHELVVRRVLQHVDAGLETRLREACEQLIRAHAQALLPPLRDEIERVVRESVSQAFAREMPAPQEQPDSPKPTLS